MTVEEFHKTLLEYHRENQNFIDKWTFTAALGSIPLAIAFIPTAKTMCGAGKLVFVFVNICAVAVVVAHIIGATCGKKQCDIMLGNGKNADCYGRGQRICNWGVNIAFCLMVVGYLLIMGGLIYGG